MIRSERPLIIIGGATGVGKTELSIRLAKAVGGSVISADSMQVYRKMNIGTAKISPEEMQGVKHYLIDILDPEESFSIFEFQRRAKEAIEEIYNNNEIPILVGGTGFYTQSVIYDIDFSDEESDKSYRDSLEKTAATQGPEVLYEMLKKVDPESAVQIHMNNLKRVIRALDYYHETGRKISDHNNEQKEKVSPYNYAYFVLNRERDVMYERINKRVDIMIENGLVDEVRSLMNSGISLQTTSMQGLGYKEIAEYIKGNVTLDEAVEILKTNTRHFAKRQITWFKRENEAVWVNYEDHNGPDEMLEFMINVLKEKEIV